MAGSKTQAFAADMLDHIINTTGAEVTVDSTMFIHLYNTTLNTAATPATTGRVGSTAAGDNYTPAKITNSTATWTRATTANPAATANKVEISFTTSASTGWGTVQAILITSSSGTGGVAYYWADVSPTQAVSAGNIVKFSTGALDITEI